MSLERTSCRRDQARTYWNFCFFCLLFSLQTWNINKCPFMCYLHFFVRCLKDWNMCVINRRNDKVKMLRKCFDAYKSVPWNECKYLWKGFVDLWCAILIHKRITLQFKYSSPNKPTMMSKKPEILSCSRSCRGPTISCALDCDKWK